MARPCLTSNNEYTRSIRSPGRTPSVTAANDYFSNTSRKRQRADSSHGKSTNQWTPVGNEDDVSFSTESLHINERYKLQGGFDTPGLLANGELDTPTEHDVDARRTMRDAVQTLRITDPSLAGPLARERNGFGRRTTTQDTAPSWTRRAIALPFSIAGKMFSFGSSMLKGFYAGTGNGFELGGKAATTSPQQDSPAIIPGSWLDSSPQQDFMGDFEQDNTPPSSRPSNKRRLTDKDTWVMVSTADVEPSKPASPKRQLFPISTPRRAASLRSRKTLSRRQSYNTPTISPALLSQESSEPLTRLPLFVRQASPVRQSPRGNYNSPDAERFARRQAKQERAADKAMSSMSRQLEEMIRQGQAALGTNFTVEDNDFDDEGFIDEG